MSTTKTKWAKLVLCLKDDNQDLQIPNISQKEPGKKKERQGRQEK